MVLRSSDGSPFQRTAHDPQNVAKDSLSLVWVIVGCSQSDGYL